MGVDLFVKDPEEITKVAEVNDIIYNIAKYRKLKRCEEAGVLLIQRRSFSALYIITSKEEAEEYLARPILDEPGGRRTCEWGLEFYSLRYFEALRRRLDGEKNVRLPRPSHRRY